jgi:hypothetical protein
MTREFREQVDEYIKYIHAKRMGITGIRRRDEL